MRIKILTVGDEILIGQTVDTNSAWMGQQLNLIGAEVINIMSVQDDHQSIYLGLGRALKNTDVVLMTGGLGPTKDDITKQAIADFFGVKMVFDEATFIRIDKLMQRFGRPVTSGHKQQCYMPENASLLSNKMGTAPGMWFEYQGKVLISMPGVPYEMKWIMEHEVLPRLKEKFPSSPIVHRTLLTAGMGESTLAAIIEDFEDALPPQIKLAYLPSLGQVKLRLTARGDNEGALTKLIEQKKEELSKQVSAHVYGKGEETLEGNIGKELKEKRLTLGTAESCTGGYIAHRLTSVSGSSAYFMGSIVSYSNKVKMKQLGVSPETLKQHGAVSEQTVKEMLAGAIENLEVDLAVATSGIAGPDGGTPEKPVGTIWMAVGNKQKAITHCLNLGKNRSKNIEYTGTFALDMVRRFLSSH